ncbi:MAG: asparagine synthase (glutamine-hydrolyzing) [Gemmatimonadota bacterium]|nr:asparagine synthase (glutamine-hydrolyzing) [Gemmatimonadota bacterium]
MCGLVAVMARGGAWTRDALERATDTLAHRGPDGRGTWVNPHGKVGLGHTRLSVIGLENGVQPICSEDGRLHLSANGEFYGFEPIRRDLENRGHVFATGSDSEIALHLYEERGRSCVESLRGEFAFVLWDENLQTLWAVRDRFGIKPLYYAEADGVLYLASEVKALLAAGVHAAWDEETVFQQIFACFDTERTLFRGVRQVPPGHGLVAREGELRIERYWDVEYPRGASVSDWDPATCVDQVRYRLEESIRLRMRADVPVGCLLSGGLDSSALLGMAARHSSRPKAFSISFDHAAYDEEPVARRTARHLGVEFETVPVSQGDCADHFSDAVWHAEAIQANAHGVARYLLSRAVRRSGYKTVLAGEGADELFAGYEFCRPALDLGPRRGVIDWLRIGLALIGAQSPAERKVAGTSAWLVRVSRILGLSSEVLDSLAGKLDILNGLLTKDFSERIAKRDPYRIFFDQFDYRKQLAGREPVKQVLYLWLKSLFVGYNLAAERADMAHGLEVRLPYLDHLFFEFGSRIPSRLLARDGQPKFPLREAARPILTEEVYRGGKNPFLAPPSTLQPENRLFEMCRDTLRGPGMRDLPFFDTGRVTRLLDRLPGMDDGRRAALDPLIMALTSLCVLQERYDM